MCLSVVLFTHRFIIVLYTYLIPLFLTQAFLSELYVYLIDQMHVGLGKVLNIEDQNPIPEPLTDSAQLKHFAREAEVNENFELAARYYQEVNSVH